MHVLFYDAATPSPYDSSTPRQQALGGTEATVIRIAQALKDHHQVSVAQHCRASSNDILSEDVNYLSFETAHRLKPDVVILLRQYRLADQVAKHYPQARHYLWLHNMPSRDLYSVEQALLQHRYTLIAVSQFHRKAIERRLQGGWLKRLLGSQSKVPVKVLYNPIDDALQPDMSLIKPQQLLFMSSPQKGLAESLKTFEGLRKVFPEYELLIANPGYSHLEVKLPDQARFLGALPREQIIQTLRESFCVFYPQHVRVETFGLVYAEANAVGTPVLAHDAGAAREVLSDAGQVVDGRRLDEVVGKIREWRERRPVLRGKDEFRLGAVTKEWLRELA